MKKKDADFSTKLFKLERHESTSSPSCAFHHLKMVSELVTHIDKSCEFEFHFVLNICGFVPNLICIGPVGWGSRIHLLHLCREVSLSQRVSWI